MIGGGEARRFFGKAEDDLRALRAMGASEDFSDEIFGFHAQQAVEKLFKSWLLKLGAEIVKTHDLDYLLGTLEENTESIPEMFRHLVDLSDFAVMFRYETLELHRSLDRTDIIFTIGQLAAHVKKLIAENS